MLAFLLRLTKQNTTDGYVLLRDRRKVSTSILFQIVFLGWKLSPIINRRGGGAGGIGIRMSWVEKNQKINYRGRANGHLLDSQEYL